jgi:hypothetical protein
MKKFIFLAVLIVVLGSASFFFYKNEDKPETVRKDLPKLKVSDSRKKALKILEKRTIARKALTKLNTKNDRTITKEEQRIIELSSKGLGVTDLNAQMLASYKQLAPKNIDLHNFIKEFSFKDEFEKELAKLDSESLRIIGELEDHPLSKELSESSQTANEEIDQFMKTGKHSPISEEKQQLIDMVTNETSAHESMDKLTRNIIESTVQYKLTTDQSKLNQSEVELKAIETADSYMQKQSATFKKIVDISYSTLSEKKLEEYAAFLQKINAKEATSLSTRALEPVFYRFSIGVLNRLSNKRKK